MGWRTWCVRCCWAACGTRCVAPPLPRTALARRRRARRRRRRIKLQQELAEDFDSLCLINKGNEYKPIGSRARSCDKSSEETRQNPQVEELWRSDKSREEKDRAATWIGCFWIKVALLK